MADNDAQVELKKRARRRLVGAIALAMGAAVLLPMIMDSEPRPTGNELQIRIPSQEGGNVASRMIKGVAEAPSAPKLPSSSRPSTVSASTPGVASESAAASQPAAGMNAAKPEEGGGSRPVPKNAAPVAKPEVASKPALPEANRARSILEGKEEAPIREAFFVQIGVYRDEANARDIKSKASSQGVKVSAETVGDKTRVRAGPFPDRATADAVVTKLKKAGIAGIVVAK